MGQPLRRRTVEPELDLPVLRLPSQRVEFPGGDDAAVVDDRDVLADVLDQVELVAGEEDGGAAFCLRAQQLGERLHGDRIEPCERLVEHEQLRLVHERRRKLRPLLVAMRELLQLRRRPLGKAEPLQPRLRGRPRLVCVHAVQAAEVGDLLGDRHPRIETALLRHVAEAQPVLELHRPPIPEHLARIRLDQPEDRAHRRRLAGAVRPEEAEHPAALDRERAAVERLHLTEPLVDVDDAQHRSGDVAARDEDCTGGDEGGDVAEQE